MRGALAAEIAPWEIALALVGAAVMVVGAAIATFGLVDLLRPRIQSTIAAAAGIERQLLDATPPEHYRRRGRRHALRGGAIAAAGFATLWVNALVHALD